ncbi:EAL domain-containing protein [soil metagenome]
MQFPVLSKYLSILSHSPQLGTSVWLDEKGRAQGGYFNCTLTSAFQPIRRLDSFGISSYEARARSQSESDDGLSVWKLLDHAADDDESIALDRLCRMLHVINFFRQCEAADADLYLAVHARLLTAVGTNHGVAFRKILDGLGLPIEKIVLQLPAATPQHGFILSYVADNYRRNGFRIAVNANNIADALELAVHMRPDVIKLDAREANDESACLRLLELARENAIQIVFKRLEHATTRELLQRLGLLSGQTIHAQGYLLDLPGASLGRFGLALPRPCVGHDASHTGWAI